MRYRSYVPVTSKFTVLLKLDWMKAWRQWLSQGSSNVQVYCITETQILKRWQALKNGSSNVQVYCITETMYKRLIVTNL